MFELCSDFMGVFLYVVLYCYVFEVIVQIVVMNQCFDGLQCLLLLLYDVMGCVIVLMCDQVCQLGNWCVKIVCGYYCIVFVDGFCIDYQYIQVVIGQVGCCQQVGYVSINYQYVCLCGFGKWVEVV